MPTKNKQIFQIKVTLDNIKPVISRKVLVESDTNLESFHYIVQSVMGWTDSHLHQFIKDQVFYIADDEGFDSDRTVNYIDKKLKLNDLLSEEKQNIQYEYDFGDSWRHTITLEKIVEAELGKKYPICIQGQNACPPEDCGGVWGYQNLLEVIKNKKHPEHNDMMEWLGGEFDPKFFDIEEVNKLLRS